MSINLIHGSTNRIIFQELYNLLNKTKNNITTLDDWERNKKMTNPYELIHIVSKYDNINHSISSYVPISRSYFKLWEILHYYKIIDNTTHKIACLAEGPGGFIEAIYNFINKYQSQDILKKIEIYGITLQTDSKTVPNWKKMMNSKVMSSDCLNVYYGNLYNIDDLKEYAAKFKDNPADIITADGGFDYSSDFDNQEQQFFRLIFCEIVCALSIQKNGGKFICKIVDIFSIFTIKLIALLKKYYTEVHIYKPLTSRPANSEKYIVAIGFIGISQNIIDELYNAVISWTNDVVDISGVEVSNELVKHLYNYNVKYVDKQIEALNSTINIINNKPNKNDYINIVKTQVKNAINWCNEYNVPINKNSRFINYLKV